MTENVVEGDGRMGERMDAAVLLGVMNTLDGRHHDLQARIRVCLDGLKEDGGAGSGNWGHAGRKGLRGGSAPGGGKNPGSGNHLGSRYAFSNGPGAEQTNGVETKGPEVSPAIASRKLSSGHVQRMTEAYNAAKAVFAEKAPEREALNRAIEEARSLRRKWDLQGELGDMHREIAGKVAEYGITAKTEVDLLETGIEFNPPQKWDRPLPEDEIIKRISGGDKTEGSCSSLALAYAAQKKGYDVQDFRGGESTEFFGDRHNIDRIIMDCETADSVGRQIASSDGDMGCAYNAKAVLKEMEEGKEYFFTSAQHAAIVRVQKGKPQYLELQSPRPEENGWTDFDDDIEVTLNRRFGAGGEAELSCSNAEAFDINLLGGENFGRILSYLNTNAGRQQKGEDGSMR